MFEHLLDDDSIGAQELTNAYAGLRFGLLAAASGAPEGARAVVESDAAGASSLRASAPVVGAGAPRSRALLRALARDPFDGAIAIDLELALMEEAAMQAPEASPPLLGVLGRMRPRLTLAWLDEVVATPELLHAFAAEEAERDGATLVVLAPAGADLSPLVRIFESDPLLSDERLDAQVLNAPPTSPAKRLLASRADAVLGVSRPEEPYDDLAASPAVERIAGIHI